MNFYDCCDKKSKINSGDPSEFIPMVARLGLRSDGHKRKIRSNEKGWLDNNIHRGYKRKKSMKKLIAVVFVAAIVTIVLVVIMNAVAALSPGNPKTGSYDGIWVGNASYGGEICGVDAFKIRMNTRQFL